MRTIVFWGSMLGPPILGNYHIFEARVVVRYFLVFWDLEFLYVFLWAVLQGRD